MKNQNNSGDWCLVYFIEEFQKEVKKRGIE